MALTHTVALRDQIANLVVQQVDLGNVNPTGLLVIFDVNDDVIATLPLSKPSFGPAVNGTCIANAIGNDEAPVVGGIPARFEVWDCYGNWVFRGSCGPSGDLGAPAVSIILSTIASCYELVYNAPQ